MTEKNKKLRIVLITFAAAITLLFAAFLSSVFGAIGLANSVNAETAQNSEQTYKPKKPNDGKLPERETEYLGSTIFSRAIGRVTEEGASEVIVVGNKVKDGEYVEDIRIIVRDLKNRKAGITITPKENSGYSPAVTLADFTGDGIKEIFYQANGGGSGAFSYSYVYSVKDGVPETLFDFENRQNDFAAEYANYYKVVVKNTATGAVYYIDISGRGEEYLGGLYNEDGTLKTPVTAEVSAVNTVLPFFQAEENRYDLLVLRRITGLYSADSFGYMQEFLSYGESGFTPYFEGVLINQNRK